MSHDRTGSELKRGMFFNTIALLASNFRGVFTFLIARLLGAAALGTFLVAWATTDVLSKIGMFGLDNSIIAFIARAERAGEHARSRALFHLAVLLAVGQSTIVAAFAILIVQFAGSRLGLDPMMAGVLSVLLCAMPGVNLYRVCTAISRGMKVMKHDIFSRGMAEPIVTTLAFLAVVALGWNTFGSAIAAIIGTGASGLVALVLASSLFRSAPSARGVISYRAEARRLLSYSASISGYDLLNALIVRVDVIMLGCFIGHAPGVTLPAVGIYGAVVEVGSGLRKVNQAFTPIFAPLVAGMTAQGEQEHAAATFSRVAQWMLWILFPLLAVMALAGPLMLSIYGPAFDRARFGSTSLLAGLRHKLLCRTRRNGDHGATAGTESSELGHYRGRGGDRKFLSDQVVRRDRSGFRNSSAVRAARNLAASHAAPCFRLGKTMEQRRASLRGRGHRSPARNWLPVFSSRNRG